MKTKSEVLKFEISDLEISYELKNELKEAFSGYRRMGIAISILNIQQDILTVKIEQTLLINGNILNNKQLYIRAREVFGAVTNYKIRIFPVVFSLQVDNINLAWINDKMKEFGINRKDLIKQLALDKSYLSNIMTGKIGLTRFAKASFYYYFLTFELNRNFQDYLDNY